MGGGGMGGAYGAGAFGGGGLGGVGLWGDAGTGGPGVGGTGWSSMVGSCVFILVFSVYFHSFMPFTCVFAYMNV